MDEARDIVVFDPDPLLRELITTGFLLHRPEWTLHPVENAEEAIAATWRRRVHLVLAALEIPGDSRGGLELVEALARREPRIPAIVLAETPSRALDGRVRPRAVVAKPPDMDVLFRRAEQVLEGTKESIVHGISVETFLQILEVERKTCTVTVRAADTEGRIFFRDGRLIHAEAAPEKGRDALFRILSWSAPDLRVHDHCRARPSIDDALRSLLLEFAVQRDHELHP